MEKKSIENILGNFKFKFNFRISKRITSGLAMTLNKVLLRHNEIFSFAFLEIISLVDLNWMASDIS